MIVIGKKPRIVYLKASNDMSHFTPSHFEVEGGFCLVSDDMFLKLKTFTDPTLNKYEEYANAVVTRGHEKQIEYLKSVMSFNPRGGPIWEYNALALNYKDYVRKMAILGESLDERIRWWERFLIFPFLCVGCGILNVLNFWKAAYERHQWALMGDIK
jgi:hypothetical protein